MELELRHLRYFVAVAEERHFGRAAERLHIAQPPLSRQIARLEQELGAELFDRATRPIRLTAAGAAFLDEAQFILAQTRRALERGRRTARGERGHLSVAGLPWAYGGILPSVVRAFRARVPDASLELSTHAPFDQIDAVGRKWLDVGLTRPVIETRSVCVEPLLEEKMMAIVPEEHPLAERPQISFADLASESFVSIAEDAAPGFVYEQTTEFARRGIAPQVVHEAPGPQAQLALVAAGVGVGLHLTASSDLRHPGVALVPIEGDAPIQTLALVWRRNDDRELVRIFLDTARELARGLAPP